MSNRSDSELCLTTTKSRMMIWYMYHENASNPPPPPPVVDSLLIAAPIVCGDSVTGPCFDMQYLVFFLVLRGREKRELVAFL